MSQPKRVFTVTGVLTASTTDRVISSIRGILRSIPAPAPLPATFLTAAEVDVDNVGMDALYNLRGLNHRLDVAAVYLYAHGTLLVVDVHLSQCRLDTADDGIGGDELGVHHCGSRRLHIFRKPMSVTSSMGARNSGRSPKSIFPIFIMIQ